MPLALMPLPLVNRIVNGFAALFRKSRVEQELDDELREFLEASIEDKMQRGMSREAAARAARMELGGVEAVKDRVRDAGWESAIESAWRDLRYAARVLRKSPIFTTVAVLSLALGIGANTAIFSVIDTLMLRPLPVKDPRQLVEILTHYPGDPRMSAFAWRYYERFRDGNHVFSDVMAASRSRVQVRRSDARAGAENTEELEGWYVSGNFFTGLGLQPAAGRLIDPQDELTTASGVDASREAIAVVSWSYWQSRFNGDPAIVGQRIDIAGTPATIAGVAPRGFYGLVAGFAPDVWLPASMEPRRAKGDLTVAIVARLKPGVSIEQARAELAVLDRARIEEIATRTGNFGWRQASLDVVPASAGLVEMRDRFSAPVLVLMAIVSLLLLLGCANLASLMLARGAARQTEMAIRISLGAGRFRLARQLLTESLLLSAIGGAFGILLAYFSANTLMRVLGSGRMPGLPNGIQLDIQPDARVLLFTAGVSMLTGLMFGIAPAWHAFTASPAASLRDIGRTGESRSRRLFGKSLVIAQVALSVVLLSVAGLFAGHVSNLRNLDLGFQRDSVLLVTVEPRGSGYQREQLTALYSSLLARLEAIPGVRSATLTGITPIQGAGASNLVSVEGVPEAREARRYIALNWVGPRYFETFRTPLLAGREFAAEDAGRTPVAIVNQAMAQHYFGTGNPIGRHVTIDGDTTSYEIVGVVANAKYSDLHEAAPRTMYLDTFQNARGVSRHFALRTAVAPETVAGDARRAVQEVLKGVSVAKVTTLSEQIDAAIVPERLMASFAGLFAVLGALLAAIGMYGLLAYSVARRTSEIGTRMALGATERDVTVMVQKGALTLVGAGLLLGAPLALWGRQFAMTIVANLPANAASTIAASAIAMLVIALLAAYIPARRAARVAPVEALRRLA